MISRARKKNRKKKKLSTRSAHCIERGRSHYSHAARWWWCSAAEAAFSYINLLELYKTIKEGRRIARDRMNSRDFATGIILWRDVVSLRLVEDVSIYTSEASFTPFVWFTCSRRRGSTAVDSSSTCSTDWPGSSHRRRLKVDVDTPTAFAVFARRFRTRSAGRGLPARRHGARRFRVSVPTTIRHTTTTRGNVLWPSSAHPYWPVP